MLSSNRMSTPTKPTPGANSHPSGSVPACKGQFQAQKGHVSSVASQHEISMAIQHMVEEENLAHDLRKLITTLRALVISGGLPPFVHGSRHGKWIPSSFHFIESVSVFFFLESEFLRHAESSSNNLHDLDPEIDRTLHRLRKIKNTNVESSDSLFPFLILLIIHLLLTLNFLIVAIVVFTLSQSLTVLRIKPKNQSR
ncbi:hypothetical protein CR513_57711, partial [Mucuna pruriens]